MRKWIKYINKKTLQYGVLESQCVLLEKCEWDLPFCFFKSVIFFCSYLYSDVGFNLEEALIDDQNEVAKDTEKNSPPSQGKSRSSDRG